MMGRYRIPGLALLVLLIGAALTASEQKIGRIGDLQTEAGTVIRDCFVGYRTYGVINGDSSNIVIMPTWFGGISESVGHVARPGSIIDSSRYYVIVIDALGNGVSSSPSNSDLQPGKLFPRFTLADMVNSQHRLLTQNLHIRHVHAVIGGSMGGMQVFNWIVEYPDFMDKAVSWVGSPRASASDRLSWTLQARIIDEGEDCGQPDSVIIKNVNLLQDMIVYTPEYRSLSTPYEKIDSYLDGIRSTLGATYTLDNFRWQLEAMIHNNITRNYHDSMEETASHIHAEMLIIVNRQDHIVSPLPPLQFAKILHARTLILNNNRGHLGITPEMKKVSKTIRNFLK